MIASPLKSTRTRRLFVPSEGPVSDKSPTIPARRVDDSILDDVRRRLVVIEIRGRVHGSDTVILVELIDASVEKFRDPFVWKPRGAPWTTSGLS